MADSLIPSLVRAPLQERSRRTLERILAAGWELLEKGGPDALTVQAITRRARTSVGSFYARFQGKDDLLRYMGEGSLEDAVARWEALRDGLRASDGPSRPADRMRHHLERLVWGLGELYLTGPGRELALMEGIEDPAPTRRRRLEDRLAEELSGPLGGAGVRSELAVRVLAGTLHDAAGRAAIAGDSGSSPYPDAEVLLPELVELLTGYLGGRVRPPRIVEGAATASRAEPKSPPAPPESRGEPDGDEAAGEQAERDAPVEGEAPVGAEEAAPQELPSEPAVEPDPFEVWG